MEEEASRVQESVEVPAGVMRVLCDALAARIDAAVEQVEPSQPVSRYHAKDLADRHRLIVELEKAFDIALDASAFESAKTVQDLGALIARQIAAKQAAKKGRRYIVVYKDAAGRMVETHVHARNHNEAVESLRPEGLDQVLSVTRADDEDDEDRYGRKIGNCWDGCVIPFLLAVAVAAVVVGLYWMRHN